VRNFNVERRIDDRLGIAQYTEERSQIRVFEDDDVRVSRVFRDEFPKSCVPEAMPPGNDVGNRNLIQDRIVLIDSVLCRFWHCDFAESMVDFPDLLA